MTRVRVLILSMHDNEEFLFEALRAGASGYVLKSAAEADLVAACRTARRGEPFLYPKAVGALVRDYLGRVERGELTPGDVLTPRETEVVKLIAEPTPAAGSARSCRSAPRRWSATVPTCSRS